MAIGTGNGVGVRSALGDRAILSLTVAGIIPGLGYFIFFLAGILGIIDSVRLLEHLPAALAPVTIAGLVCSVVVGLSSETALSRVAEIRAWMLLAVLLMVVDVPLILVQLVVMFAFD